MFNEKLALLYGILLGDGCLSKVEPKHHFISIVGHLHDDLAFFKEIVSPLLKQIAKRDIKIRKRLNQRKLEILFTHKKLFYFLNGIGFPIGKKGTKLNIPCCFNNNLDNIIQGFFATDGSIVITNNNGTVYPRIEFTSISKEILSQILEYLNKLGLKGNIYKTSYANNWNTRYRLQFNGKKNLEIFKENIGFLNPKHKAKYKKYAGGGT